MVRRRQRERRLFEVLLPDGHKLWPEWLRRIDTLLEDESVIEVVAHALEQRWPQSRRRGRPGTPAEIVIRMLILKHLFDWSYDDLEQEVRANLVYRAFTRIDADEVPDAKTILKIAGTLGPDVVAQLHRQVVDVAKRAGVTRGRRFRIDTTVVETNVHYPTDSTLLQDGVRVLTRTMHRASAADAVAGKEKADAVAAKKKADAAAARARAQIAPIRVGGQIRAPKKIKDVKPVYPAIAQSARVAGAVTIEATIGPDGKVIDAKVVHSIPMLDQAALDAVRQWVYTPTLLNGVPVPVLVTVTINFTR